MTTEDYLREADQAVADHRKKSSKKQTEVEIFNHCKEKFLRTNDHIKELEEKKRNLEEEISHLQQKQIDRKKFLEEVTQRYQKN
jgi:predicted transcriptional regulator